MEATAQPERLNQEGFVAFQERTAEEGPDRDAQPAAVSNPTEARSATASTAPPSRRCSRGSAGGSCSPATRRWRCSATIPGTSWPGRIPEPAGVPGDDLLARVPGDRPPAHRGADQGRAAPDGPGGEMSRWPLAPPWSRAIALVLGLGAVPPAAAAVKLHRCDLGAARPLRCGHITVADAARRPLARNDQGRLRGPAPRATARGPRWGRSSRPTAAPGYGSTAAPFVRSVNAALAPLLRRREIVYVDARGTGLSDALDCRTLQRGLILESTAIGECANQLGPRFAGYTTGETADDLDAVREALGLGKVFYYGDSYGTLLGQAYAVRHPGSLRGLILDSAYPADDPYYRTLLPAGLHGLEIACRRAPGLLRGRGRALLPRRPPLPRPGTADRRPAQLPAPVRDPGAAVLPQPRRRRPPLPRRRPAPAQPPDRARHSRPRLDPGIHLRARDHRRVQRLSAALGPVLIDRRPDPPALDVGEADPRRQLRPVRRPRVPALAGLAPDQLPDLAGAAAPAGLEPPVPAGWRAPTQLPDPDPRGEVDDITSVTEAQAGEAAVPAIDPQHHTRPRPCLEPLLPVPLARGRRDPEVHSHPLARTCEDRPRSVRSRRTRRSEGVS